MDKGIIVVAMMAIVAVSILVITQTDSNAQFTGEVTLIEEIEGEDLLLDATGNIVYKPVGEAPEELFESTQDTRKPGSDQKGYNKRFNCQKQCFCTGTTCRCTSGGCIRVD